MRYLRLISSFEDSGYSPVSHCRSIYGLASITFTGGAPSLASGLRGKAEDPLAGL